MINIYFDLTDKKANTWILDLNRLTIKPFDELNCLLCYIFDTWFRFVSLRMQFFKESELRRHC